MDNTLNIQIGVKTDPIEYRYSFEWLFRLLQQEGIRHVQLGTFFELYHLPDDYFLELRERANEFDIDISSVFTAHRELGGFLSGDPAFERVARRNFRRLIEVGALLGVRSVGSNPGAVLRDRMELKANGIRCYIEHMKAMMAYAFGRGVPALAMEPMSCIAEPPTLPDEIRDMADELAAHHEALPETVPVGYCTDISHGYADSEGVVRHTHLELLEATLPYLSELHLKNTDAMFSSTFGFTAENRANGIVDLSVIKSLLRDNQDRIPYNQIVAYFEISGPKLGRDYSDRTLEKELRESLRHIRSVFDREGANVS